METRTKKYSKKNRMKRKIKKQLKNITFKRVVKLILRNIAYLIVGLSYTCYLILRAFNNFIAKLFMNLPRMAKITLIYILVLNFGNDAYNSIKTLNLVNNKKTVAMVEKVMPTELKQEVVETEQEKTTEETTCIYDETSCLIYNKAKKIGMTEEQTLISISISKWETGRYTSSAFINLNNIGGMYCNTGLIKYDSLEEGISAFLNNLKNNYFDIGLDTFEKIGKKYCPVGAKNDPTGLNQYWVNGTKTMYDELLTK